VTNRTNYPYTLKVGWMWVWRDLRYGNPLLALRTFYWAILRGWDGETCQFCARPYIDWHAGDSLYRTVMGSLRGLACPSCFHARAHRMGIWLTWVPELWEDNIRKPLEVWEAVG
jgi:hypothetical protein